MTKDDERPSVETGQFTAPTAEERKARFYRECDEAGRAFGARIQAVGGIFCVAVFNLETRRFHCVTNVRTEHIDMFLEDFAEDMKAGREQLEVAFETARADRTREGGQGGPLS